MEGKGGKEETEQESVGGNEKREECMSGER